MTPRDVVAVGELREPFSVERGRVAGPRLCFSLLRAAWRPNHQGQGIEQIGIQRLTISSEGIRHSRIHDLGQATVEWL